MHPSLASVRSPPRPAPSRRLRVVCTVEPAKTSTTIDHRLMRLMRGDHTVASGRGKRIFGTGRLPKGRYTLVVGRGEGAVRLPVVIR